MTSFYSRETSCWYDTDDPDFTWIECDFCNKSFPSEAGSVFCDGTLYEINFDEKVACELPFEERNSKGINVTNSDSKIATKMVAD